MRGQRRFGTVKPKDKKKTIKRLMSYLLGYKKQLFLVFFCIILSALAGVLGSLFLEVVIDSYIIPITQMENPVYTGLLKAIATMALIYLVGILSTLFYNRVMVTISQGILKTVRDEMFSHMQKLPIKYFDTHTFGEVMSYYTNDTDALRQMLSMSIPQMFSSIITVILTFFAMLKTSVHLTLLVIVCVFVVVNVSKKITSKCGKYFAGQQKSLALVNGYAEEMTNGQKVVKVFCYEEESKENFDKLSEELYENAYKANKFANILMPIIGNLGHLQYVLVATVGGFLAVSGTGGVTLGAIASFLQLSKSFSNPIGQMSQQLNAVVMALAGAERIFELLDEEPEEDNGYVTLVNAKIENGEIKESDKRTGMWAWKHPHSDGTVTYTKLKGDVKFFDVDFGYTDEKTVLKNVTLYANPGEKVAFVGATGAGKTTITNLINRFYDIQDGKIRYDDININKIKKSDLRRSLGIVLQDTNLFTGTIKENIRYGNLNATDEEIIEAAKLANAHNFIMMLPDGYDTEISGNGEGLSQGQRQLISIARAAASDPPVMILDEATSSIDTRTEAIVQRGMDSLMKGRTVFVIAHRLSTVKNSDVIMVLENGEIIERGNHEKLIEEKGKYYRLYTGAFELE